MTQNDIHGSTVLSAGVKHGVGGILAEGTEGAKHRERIDMARLGRLIEIVWCQHVTAKPGMETFPVFLRIDLLHR